MRLLAQAWSLLLLHGLESRSCVADDKTKHFSNFDEAVEFVEAHPECVNNRAHGESGWTLLHQAAFWTADAQILSRLRAAGAQPELVGQTGAQLVKGEDGDTPMGITNDKVETAAEREEWRVSFRAVFGLADGQAEPEAEAEPEPEPEAEAAPEPQ